MIKFVFQSGKEGKEKKQYFIFADSLAQARRRLRLEPGICVTDLPELVGWERLPIVSKTVQPDLF